MSAHAADEDPLERSYDWQLLKRLLRYLRPYVPQVLGSFVLTMLATRQERRALETEIERFGVALARNLAGDAKIALLALLGWGAAFQHRRRLLDGTGSAPVVGPSDARVLVAAAVVALVPVVLVNYPATAADARSIWWLHAAWFRSGGDLARALLHLLGIVPGGTRAEMGSIDLSQVVPTEYRADAVTVFWDQEVARAAAIIEVQLQYDPDKRRSWPVYVAALRAALDCRRLAARDALAARAHLTFRERHLMNWIRDVHHAFRRFRRQPVPAAVAVLTLGLGLGEDLAAAQGVAVQSKGAA